LVLSGQPVPKIRDGMKEGGEYINLVIVLDLVIVSAIVVTSSSHNLQADVYKHRVKKRYDNVILFLLPISIIPTHEREHGHSCPCFTRNKRVGKPGINLSAETRTSIYVVLTTAVPIINTIHRNVQKCLSQRHGGTEVFFEISIVVSCDPFFMSHSTKIQTPLPYTMHKCDWSNAVATSQIACIPHKQKSNPIISTRLGILFSIGRTQLSSLALTTHSPGSGVVCCSIFLPVYFPSVYNAKNKYCIINKNIHNAVVSDSKFTQTGKCSF